MCSLCFVQYHVVVFHLVEEMLDSRVGGSVQTELRRTAPLSPPLALGISAPFAGQKTALPNHSRDKLPFFS